MFEYIIIHSTNKSYYDYRKCIYVFRGSYLAYFLYFNVEYLKWLFSVFDNSPLMTSLVALTLELLEQVFMYPYTLGVH